LAILHGGIGTMTKLVTDSRAWMDEREFTEIAEMRGMHSKDRSVYTRANYLRILPRYAAA
jgi:hypothetical protein